MFEDAQRFEDNCVDEEENSRRSKAAAAVAAAQAMTSNSTSGLVCPTSGRACQARIALLPHMCIHPGIAPLSVS